MRISQSVKLAVLRGYAYEDKTCAHCGGKFRPRSGVQKYCDSCISFFPTLQKLRAKWHRKRQREMTDPQKHARLLERNKTYYLKHRKERHEYQKIRLRKLQLLWTGQFKIKEKLSETGNCLRIRGNKAEEHTIGILQKEGFTNVKRINLRNVNMPFDIRAEKDGRICVFETTTNIFHRDDGRFELAKDLNLDFYLVFLRPNYQGYFLMKVTEERKTYFIGANNLREVVEPSVSR